MEPADVRWALRAAVSEYRRSWDFLRRLRTPAIETVSDAQAQLPQPEETPGTEPGPVVSPAKLATATSDALRLTAGRAANDLLTAARDPSTRSKLGAAATGALVSAHTVVDAFLLGYYDGQAQELKKSAAEDGSETVSSALRVLERAFTAATHSGDPTASANIPPPPQQQKPT